MLAVVTVPQLVDRADRGLPISAVELLAGAAELVAARRRPLLPDSPETARLRRQTLDLADRFIAAARVSSDPASVAAFWLSPLPSDPDPAVRNWQYRLEQGVTLADAAVELTSQQLRTKLEQPFHVAASDAVRVTLLLGAREPDGARRAEQRERADAWALLAALHFDLLAADSQPGAAQRQVVSAPAWVQCSPRLTDLETFPLCVVVEGGADEERARAMLSLWPLPSPDAADIVDLWELTAEL